MATYFYSAADRAGKPVKGEREAENERALAQSLRAEGLFLVAAEDVSKSKVSLFSLQNSAKEFYVRIRPVGVVEKIFFVRNLMVMISAGISLTKALDGLAHETANTKFRDIIEDVNRAVVKGQTFAGALRAHTDIFDDLFINMIDAGEASGKLVTVLKLLARQMKKDYDIKKRVRGAMMYPGIILITLLGIGVFMMLYVVPTITATLTGLGVALPLTTQIIIGVSSFLVDYSFFVLVGLIMLGVGIWRILKTEKGKSTWDAVVLHIPIFGSLIRQYNIARFARILSYLIAAGLPIVRALEITSSVLGNTLYRTAVRVAADEIQKGKLLYQILEKSPALFPPLVIQMVDVGEETGKISSMLLRLAIFLEEDVTNVTKNMSTIIEPILMIFIGAIVGLFALSILQPIYSGLGSL